jgi:hypothetical protein
MQPLDSIQPALNDSTRYSIRYEERLAMALNFNLDDLTANRLGAITGRQANRMRTRMLTHAKEIAVATVAGIIAFGLLIWLRMQLTTPADAQGVAGTVVVLLIAVSAILTLAFILPRGRAAYQLYKDTQTLRSAMSQGYLNLQGPDVEAGVISKRRWNSPRFYAVMEGRRYAIPEVAFLAMKKGEPYVLYYAPMSRYLLSAERLRNEREFSNNSSARAPGRAEVQLSRS